LRLDATFDRDGPIFARAHEHAPGFQIIAVLRSGRSGIHERYHLAFDTKLAPLGCDLLSRAVDDEEASAPADVGGYMLYELEDDEAARVYLERAHAAAICEVLFDLAVIALLT
jgi:hypothetical protein